MLARHERSGSSILTYITATVFRVCEAEGVCLTVEELYIRQQHSSTLFTLKMATLMYTRME